MPLTDSARVQATVRAILPGDAEVAAVARHRQSRLTKPPGSMGVLEELSARLAASTGVCPPVVDPAALVVFAGDHGVHAQGVSPWPQEVTAQMVSTFLADRAVVSALARQVGATVRVVDVGVAAELGDHPDLVQRKVSYGTADLSTGAAMTRGQVERALAAGIAEADVLVAAGHRLLVAGDMGIANTTPSAVLVAAVTGATAEQATGRGTGIDDRTWSLKAATVQKALDLHADVVAAASDDPVGLLAAVGGFEHAAIAGFLLGAAAARVPVVLDGVIACSAALVAQLMCPAAVDHWVAGHRSSEPGASLALERLGMEPLLDLGLRLGEGSGAVLAVPLVQAAARLLAEVATFDDAGVHEGG